MKKTDGQSPRPARSGTDLRLNPQHRLCPRFDAESIAAYEAPEPGRMGFRVLDNCAEEHIQ